MVEQLGLFGYFADEDAKIKEIKEPPQYDKFYSLYVFDEITYHRLLKAYMRVKKINNVYDIDYLIRKEIREICHPVDEYGKKRIKGDERHIFRMSVLQKILAKLYQEVLFKIEWTAQEVYYTYGLAIYREDEQAEIDGTQMLSIKERVKLHLQLLKMIKKGNDIENSVNEIKERFGIK
jgi:hypothetical protein